ncbi:MAG: MarR family winged helix-turn-helix transcriptional regulator [Glaciihabitans sp.]
MPEGTSDNHLIEVEQSIAQLHQATRARLRDLTDVFGADLQPAGYFVMRHVLATSPVRAGDIASALGMDKSAVSRQLTVLRGRGLVDDSRDPDDGRATLIVATDAARAAFARFRGEVRAEYARVLSDWDEAEIEQFATLLQKFNRSLGGTAPGKP